MARKTMESLEERVRQGASEFRFDALLKGPESSSVALDKNGAETPAARDRDSDPFARTLELSRADLPRRNPAGRRIVSILILAIGLAALAVAILFAVRQGVAFGQDGEASAGIRRAAVQAGRKPGLPDPALTPGRYGAAPLPETPVSRETRKRVLAAYGLASDDARHVLITLVPPALGGITSEQNLFPVTPWFADLKKRLDSRLTELVARGELSRQEAIRQLTSNWIEAVHTHYVRNYGERDDARAKATEDRLRW